MKTNCTFAEVIEALKQGKRVQRPEWNGSYFVYRPVKEYPGDPGVGPSYYCQLAQMDAEGVGEAWLPSAPDIFAEDWRIIDDEGTAPLPGFAVAGETVGTAKPLTGVL